MAVPSLSTITCTKGFSSNIAITSASAGAVDNTSQTSDKTTQTGLPFTLGIDHWEINDGHIIYEDHVLNVYKEAIGLQHQGHGDFSKNIFDLKLSTTTKALIVGYQGTTYIKNQPTTSDITLAINLPNSTFTFKENSIKISDFNFGFDGYFTFQDNQYDIDIHFSAKQNNLKNLLSLIPSFNDKKIFVNGAMKMHGFVKGTYRTKEQLPIFQIALQIHNGIIQYLGMDTPIHDIDLSILIDNPDGILKNTSLNVEQLHCKIGHSPITGNLQLKGTHPYQVTADINAKLDLAEVNTFYPVEGLTLKGLYHLHLQADGIYDSLRSAIPKLDVAMCLQDGFIQYKRIPAPFTHVNFNAAIKNTTGKMETTRMEVNNFKAMVDKEGLEGKLIITNLKNYHWNLQLKGGINLAKILEAYPMQGTKLQGYVRANINSLGKMSDLQAERYERLTTNGTLTVDRLTYQSDVLQQPVFIDKLETIFSPMNITMKHLEGRLGKSKVYLTGELSNYMNYIFKRDAIIKGNVHFTSPQIDANEWLQDNEVHTVAAAQADKNTEPTPAIEVPKNVDLVLDAKINKVRYTNLVVNDLQGKITIKDRMLQVKDMRFHALEGKFLMNTTYSTQDIKHPSFSVGLNIADVAIGQVYNKFDVMQKLTPIAKNARGKFSSTLALQGKFEKNRALLYPTLNGHSTIKIQQAYLESTSSATKAIAKLANIDNLSQIKLNDLKIETAIKDSKLYSEPFDIKIANHHTTISGSSDFEGNLDCLVKIEIPTGKVGGTVNQVLGNFGVNLSILETIWLKLGVKGHYKNPKISLIGTEFGKKKVDLKKPC